MFSMSHKKTLYCEINKRMYLQYSVIGSEGKETTGVTNEETAYVSRRLGPGYTVLVKREEEERS